MNVTYIIGNGFDLNLRLQTSYKDFYAYYIEQYPSIHDEDKVKGNEKEMEIVKLKRSIENYLRDEKGDKVNTKDANWVNLELALGQYTKEVATEELMIDLLEDIEKELTTYLRTIVDQIQVHEDGYNETIKELGEFFLHLLSDDNDVHQEHASHFSEPIRVKIISLNYTSTIEKLLNIPERQDSLDIQMRSLFRKTTYLTGLYHLHHTLDEDDCILLGVNDESQIANEEFRKNKTLKEFLIKPETNKTLRSGVARKCQEIMAQSALFIFFGVSMGCTDKYWWNLIASRLQQSDSRLIIFALDDILKNSSKKRYGQRVDKVINDFLSHSDLPNEQREHVAERITVAFNTHLFHGLRKFINIRSYIKNEATFDYSNNNGRYTIGTGMKSFTTRWGEAGKDSIYALNDSENIEAIGLLNEPTDLDALNIESLNSVDFTSSHRNPQLNDIVIWKNKHGHFAATKIVEIKIRRIDKVYELKIEYAIY